MLKSHVQPVKQLYGIFYLVCAQILSNKNSTTYLVHFSLRTTTLEDICHLAGGKKFINKMDITQGICQLYQKSSFCHDLHNVDSMVRNCCRSIRSKMRVTWRRNVAGNLIALAVVTAFVVTYVKLLQYNKASSTTFNLVANRHRRPRGLHASHTVHRGSKNATSRLAVHVVEEHHQGKCYTSQLTV